MGKDTQIEWLDQPEPHNYPAAISYLSLIYDPAKAANFVKAMETASLKTFKARDILRASGLPLAPEGNKNVAKHRRKIDEGKKLSPILLLRDTARGRVIVADGYHRLCAVCGLDEDARIPCKIASS